MAPSHPHILLETLPNQTMHAIRLMRPEHADAIIQDLSSLSRDVLLALTPTELLQLHDNLIWINDNIKAGCNVSNAKLNLIKAALAVNGEWYNTEHVIDMSLQHSDKLSEITTAMITTKHNIDAAFVDELLKLHESLLNTLSHEELIKLFDAGLTTHSTRLHQEISDVKLSALKLALALPLEDDLSSTLTYTCGVAILMAFTEETIHNFGLEKIAQFIANPHIVPYSYEDHPDWGYDQIAQAIEPLVMEALGEHA